MITAIGVPVVAAPDVELVERPTDRVDVSVIVTCHDYGAYVADAVRSALAQDGVVVEVVVVDDGSTDDSAQVLERLVGAHPGRIDLVRQPNRGQAAAMNAGFARARGPVVLFLDADDVLHPRTAARCVAALDRRGAMRVQFPMRVVDRAGRPTGRTVPADPRRLPAGDLVDAVLSHPDDLAWQPTSGNAFRSEVLDRILPMPEDPYRTCADHYLSNLSALLGEVVVLDEPGADYRVHGSNADHRDHLDVGRLRTVIGHTIATHTELARLAGELGHAFPPDPLVVPSVTFHVNRLVSLRLAPDRHPLPGDRRPRLVLDGARAAWRRQDLPRGRRAAMVGWFLATGVAPRPVARALAERALLGPAAPRPGGGPATSAEAAGASSRPAGGGDDRWRRTDWRFLLPRPATSAGVPRAVVTGAPTRAPAADLFDLGFASIVDRGAGGAPASVVACLASTAGSPGAVAAALAPGGVAWIEVDRRAPGSRWRTPDRVARAARAAGLVVEATSLIGPSPAHARRFIPLDHAGALAWYLRTQVVPGSWIQAVGLGGLRVAVALVGTGPVRSVVPSFGLVVRLPFDADDASCPPAALVSVGGAPDSDGRGAPGVVSAGGAGRSVLLTSGQDEASRAVLLPFAEGARHPSAVVKVASLPSFGPDTVAELDRLRSLHRRLGAGLAAAVPRPTASAPIGRLTIGAQTAAAGRPIEVRARSVPSRPRRTIADLDAATAWLTELHRTTRVAAPAPAGAVPCWRGLLLDPLAARRDAVVAATGTDAGRAHLLLADVDRVEARSLAALAAAGAAPLPTVERHHDFVPCNVLRGPSGLAVVDWEIPADRDSAGPALVDLLLFVTFWYAAAHRSSSPTDDLAWLDRLLTGGVDERDDPYHAAAWRAVGRYGTALSIDPALTPLALAVLWLERDAAARARRLRLHEAPTRPGDAPLAGQLEVLARRWGAADEPWRCR